MGVRENRNSTWCSCGLLDLEGNEGRVSRFQISTRRDIADGLPICIGHCLNYLRLLRCNFS